MQPHGLSVPMPHHANGRTLLARWEWFAAECKALEASVGKGEVIVVDDGSPEILERLNGLYDLALRLAFVQGMADRPARVEVGPAEYGSTDASYPRTG